MFGIGKAIGAVGKIGSSIFGGRKASKAMRQNMRSIKQDLADNQNWYDRRYNEDATQRADAQRMIQMTADAIRQRNKEAQAGAAITGASDESVALAKAGNNIGNADVASQIAANAADRKDLIEEQYIARKSNLNEAMRQSRANKAKAITEAAAQVGDTFASIGGL